MFHGARGENSLWLRAWIEAQMILPAAFVPILQRLHLLRLPLALRPISASSAAAAAAAGE